MPLERLAGDGGYALEVPVLVQQSEPLQLGRGGPAKSTAPSLGWCPRWVRTSWTCQLAGIGASG
jgi:hypothetical protein